ncbi:MAG: Asp-tRNA(Asn)/Glu-tRNA(Gln) amidotransferase subunit GatB [Candidatus Sungbacteria bacterium]|nr:Asp-tRNA(Asn)/Glu-tRNA(Gln) amidotransferase subunit GatB [Candidatus Sungbacteria bacterium]
MNYEAVIGLEIHAELNTKTKMFCYSLNDPDERHPNTNVCPICMGHPGTLPYINEDAVKKVIAVGLALNGSIGEFSRFDRKNYFYPDLPKGYQISQYKYPIVSGGYLDIEISNVKFLMSNETPSSNESKPTKRIRITRIHLEEDTGRLMHAKDGKTSLVDFNRAGVPLMELVTEPDFRTGEEVRQFGEVLQQIVRYVGASDANMEKGQMRVEVNISMRPIGQKEFGTKVEVKNINSFKYAADAAAYEMKRQFEVLERGEKIAQETRGWNEHKGISVSQRSKEEAHNYRYFPEPDLPPLRLSAAYVEEIRIHLPELPAAKQERFVKEYGIEPTQAEIIAREKAIADYFEETISETAQHDKDLSALPSAGADDSQKVPQQLKKNLVKTVTAFLVGDFMRLLKETGVPAGEVLLTPENFAEIVVLLSENKISNTTAKEVFEESFRTSANPTDIISEKGLWQMSDAGDLETIAAHIIGENPTVAADYRAGKTAVLQFLVGQVMAETRGKANPALVVDIIKKLLQ